MEPLQDSRAPRRFRLTGIARVVALACVLAAAYTVVVEGVAYVLRALGKTS